VRLAGFFARRWRGELPVRVLLGRDMLGVGTLINLACSVVALMAVAQGAPLPVALALHWAPLPYNLFLCAALWRTPGRAGWAAWCGVAWVAAMMVV
jgi:hypothetical protein